LRREPRHVVLGRRNANDGVRFSVEANCSTNERWISRETTPPQPVTEHHQARVAQDVGVGEIPPEHRPDLHDMKVARRDVYATDPLRLAVRQVVGGTRHGRRVLEDLTLFGPVVEVTDRGVSLPELPPRFVHGDDAIAVGPRQRTQEHGIQHAEDRNRRADTKRDGDQEHCSQHGAYEQLADRKPQIVSPVSPPLSSAHGPLPLFSQSSADCLHVLNVSEAAQCYLARLFA
jgi:hypothetical protein